MTFQASQIQLSDPRLLTDTSIQNSPERPFKNYLDEEQQRLVNLFSPFGQLDFSAMFAYPDFNFNSEKVSVFSDSQQPDNSNYPNYQATKQPSYQGFQEPMATANNNQPAIELFSKPLQQVFQDLLSQTGWLAPNLAANPAFFNAQADGKLLARLDLQSLVDKIASQLEMVKEKGQTQLRFGLRPESLGEILLTLTSRSGMISINIAADEKARRVLEESLNELTTMLKNAKVNLENVIVTNIKEVQENV